jgi:eukaryotic-like serine/threonine-protein kinase
MRPRVAGRHYSDLPAATERASGLERKRGGRWAIARPANDGPDPDAPILRELRLHEGALVDGTYRIVRPLGAGGMGVVTLAHDVLLDRDVAIKFVRPELLERPELRELFLTEARAMARVSHPNVLAVHAFGEHHGVSYFVMEYVDGWTVESWQTSRGLDALFDVDVAMHILDQACRGVSAIHAANTVHRDLKPSNLLMDTQLRVWVSDLGVARIHEAPRGGTPCTIVGSAIYMAPEAALGDESRPELAPRRDIYALGCIAYEVLTGRPPFTAATDVTLMAQHMLEAPPRASWVRGDLPPGYDDVLLRALRKRPEERWPTAEAFRSALLAVQHALPIPDRILIADDDDDWRALLQVALQSCFPTAEIDLVRDGDRAIEAFDHRPYAVVIVDLMMPNMDGMALTRLLRSRATAAKTPIIVMTAAGGPGEWRRLARMGADAFLVKPIEPEDVAMLIRRTLRSRLESRERSVP